MHEIDHLLFKTVDLPKFEIVGKQVKSSTFVTHEKPIDK